MASGHGWPGDGAVSGEADGIARLSRLPRYLIDERDAEAVPLSLELVQSNQAPAMPYGVVTRPAETAASRGTVASPA